MATRTTTSHATGGAAACRPRRCQSSGIAGTRACATGSLTAAKASRIAIQLSQAKFPLATSQSCVKMMIPAATLASGCGAKRKNGTTSWAKWLPRTSIRCHALGSKCACRLSGPGIGWVSWW